MVFSEPRTIRLSPADNVVVAAVELPHGTEIKMEAVICRSHIPPGHKVATKTIHTGEPVRKYNQIIGFAVCSIEQGDHVHTHNLKMNEFSRDYAIGTDARPTSYVSEGAQMSFDGIVRADGRVATRNFIGVLATVNCSATVARYIADAFREETLADFPNIDGVVALHHGT